MHNKTSIMKKLFKITLVMTLSLMIYAANPAVSQNTSGETGLGVASNYRK